MYLFLCIALYIVLFSIFVFFFIIWPSSLTGAPCRLSNVCVTDQQTCLLLHWQIIILWVERSCLSERWLIVKSVHCSDDLPCFTLYTVLWFQGCQRIVEGVWHVCDSFMACLDFATKRCFSWHKRSMRLHLPHSFKVKAKGHKPLEEWICIAKHIISFVFLVADTRL